LHYSFDFSPFYLFTISLIANKRFSILRFSFAFSFPYFFLVPCPSSFHKLCLKLVKARLLIKQISVAGTENKILLSKLQSATVQNIGFSAVSTPDKAYSDCRVFFWDYGKTENTVVKEGRGVVVFFAGCYARVTGGLTFCSQNYIVFPACGEGRDMGTAFCAYCDCFPVSGDFHRSGKVCRSKHVFA
jgi:hypothetical protein